MIVADVTYYPIGEGTSASRYVKAALEVFSRSGIKFYPNGMATVIEGNTVKEILDVIEKGEKAIIEMGIPRIETIIKIDHRLDKDNSVSHKVSSINQEH
ncbi:MAG: MTH1187 family thiamine-binding protein [Candidatus Thermoplasmatota archaeon]|nr:MTH1187 family thiamine-binding protein [Candidatus Thermoplasmatota archaeon]